MDKEFLEEKYIGEHLSCQKIADLVGDITRQGIWKRLKRNGIKTRSKEDALFIDNGIKCKLSQGYFWMYCPGHPRANGGYVKKSVLGLEEKLGRPLNDGEFPHHVDGNRLNDALDNLEPSDRSSHFAHHLLLIPVEERSKDYNKRAKRLCGNDVLQIRQMRQHGMKLQDIADYFSVGRTTISNAVYGKCWGYIKSLIFFFF